MRNQSQIVYFIELFEADLRVQKIAKMDQKSDTLDVQKRCKKRNDKKVCGKVKKEMRAPSATWVPWDPWTPWAPYVGLMSPMGAHGAPWAPWGPEDPWAPRGAVGSMYPMRRKLPMSIISTCAYIGFAQSLCITCWIDCIPSIECPSVSVLTRQASPHTARLFGVALLAIACRVSGRASSASPPARRKGLRDFLPRASWLKLHVC